jgi:hypothetical protein
LAAFASGFSGSDYRVMWRKIVWAIVNGFAPGLLSEKFMTFAGTR